MQICQKKCNIDDKVCNYHKKGNSLLTTSNSFILHIKKEKGMKHVLKYYLSYNIYSLWTENIFKLLDQSLYGTQKFIKFTIKSLRMFNAFAYF